MTNLRWEQYAPVTLGLETFFHRLDALQDNKGNYPPYNIVILEDGKHELEIALAGFSREDIEVVTERNVLTVSARRETDKRDYSHRGLSFRSFTKNWQLSDDVVVDGVRYADGLLTITLIRVLPESQKRKTLEIN